jgi:hypothetical protein
MSPVTVTGSAQVERLGVPFAARGGRELSLQVLMPTLLPGSGGHRTILTNVLACAQSGVGVRIFLRALDHRVIDLGAEKDIALSLVPGLAGTNVVFDAGDWARSAPDIATLATVAQSSHELSRVAEEKRLYFIQDRESLFNPMSAGYLEVERSYCLPSTMISIGAWIPRFLEHEYGQKAFPTPFGVDLDTYAPGTAPRAERPRVAVLVQPEKPRRLTELLTSALELLWTARPDVEIVLFGSDIGVHLRCPAKHLGLIPERSAAHLYATSHVGICLSATNPSRIPFEMLASGLPVVDVLSETTLWDFPRPQVSLAFPSPQSIAKALQHHLENPPGVDLVSVLPSREEESALFAARVRAVLEGVAQPSAAVGWEGEPHYDIPPAKCDVEQAKVWLGRLRRLAQLTAGRGDPSAA